MAKKNLDKLFQEKLKDFSEIPEEKVWKSIEASLDEKKKSRKVIPIWWKLGGVAAILIVGLFLINSFEDTTKADPAVTNVEDATPDKESEKQQKVEDFDTQEHFEDPALNVEDIENSKLAETETNGSDDAAEQVVVRENNASTLSTPEVNTTIGEKAATPISKERTTQLAEREIKKPQGESGNELISTDDKTLFLKKQEANAVAINDKSKQQGVLESNQNTNPISTDQEDAIVNNDLQQADNKASDPLEKETIEEKSNTSNKKSIFDEIAAQEEEKEALVENTGSKWSAGPSLAPVYYDAIGEGSPVHSIFVPNSKSGDVNLSYGLSVAYSISKKLSIRSGLHKVDYGYRTNDVEFSSSVNASASDQIDHVDYALTSKNLVVSSTANNRIEALNQNPFLDTSSDVTAASASRNGIMEQQFGYLEVPVELNYALIDKRFGVHLVGGISSLFLIDNSISLSSGELTTEMGEANNINAVNFSTNVGFGVDYKFTPKVRFNVEPIFKYQLNTFSATEGSFQPFSIGVYSGLTFKF